MSSYKNHIPFLKSEVSKEWVNKIPTKVFNMMNHLKNSDEFLNRDCLVQEIGMIEYIPYNGVDIDKKFTYMIKYCLNLFEVKGVWKILMIPGTNQTVKSFVMYGYPEDLHCAHRLVYCLHTGLLISFEQRVQHIRLQKKRKRAKGKVKGYPQHARTLTTDFINEKIQKINEQLLYKPATHSLEYKFKIANILRTIREREKMKTKATRGTISEFAMTARSGKISLNMMI